MSEQRVVSVAAQSGRVIVGRLLPGVDLIRGLEAACDEHNVAFAAVAFAYGSLSRASFMILRRPAGGKAVLARHDVDARVEFLAGQGLVCVNDSGARETHLHGAVSDESGRVLGGHFRPDGNPVYNNMDFQLTELTGVRLLRRHDPETDTVEMVLERTE